MREIKVTVPAEASATAPVVLDQYIAPFQVSYVKTGSGTVEVSQTNPFPVENQNFVAANFVWTTAPDLPPNANGFLGQPFRAVRLSGAAPGDTLTVVQAGVK